MYFRSFLPNYSFWYKPFKLVLIFVFFFLIHTDIRSQYKHTSVKQEKPLEPALKKRDFEKPGKDKLEKCEFVFIRESDSISIEFKNDQTTLKYKISRDSMILFQEQLFKTVSSFRQKNIGKATIEYKKTAQQLFNLLMGPAQDHITYRINIFGEGEIKNTPWSTLVKTTSKKEKYLIYDHEIILNETNVTHKNDRNHVISKFIVSPNFEGNLMLSYQDENIINLQKYSHSGKKEPHTKEGIINEIESGENDVIHFATHNYWKKKEKDFEIIISKEKETLTSLEISNLYTHSRLIFINACESSKVKDGKSLTGAFLSASAKSTIGTLWKIEDHAASKIAELFYKELSKGIPKSTALRNAQISYLDLPLLTYEQHPYFWGAYTLEGDNSPLFRAIDWNLQRISAIVFPLLTTCSMLIFYFGKNIKKKIMYRHFL